jgi:hypothetical protein
MREGKRLQEIERERAKARQAENAKTNNPNIKNPENLPDSVKGDSRDIAAKKLGMSGKNLERGIERFFLCPRINTGTVGPDFCQLCQSVFGAF